MSKSAKIQKFCLSAIAIFVSFVMVFSCMQVPKKAMAVASPHIVIAWMGGYTARIWSADPESQWTNLWMRSTNEKYARNADGIPVANFEVYTADYQNSLPDINTYSNFQYTVTADLVPDYANTPIKIFVEYYNGTFDVINGTLDNWACISFTLNKPAIITICRYLPDVPGGRGGNINYTYYSPKTGLF